ncbi:efflux RND transporter permease subunit [Kiloniella antarctica]|uniref:Efflux RND transporter permease subunit n=1 Tax=Kiloniella antarctica TaxID=1550907 RepID=A0ABW5BR94_9PROT
MNSLIRWFTLNSVSANLLMCLILLGGLISIPDIKTQIFPTIKLNAVDISIDYRGASPQAIAQNISLPIENALKDLPGIKNIYSFAVEGHGTTSVFFYSNVDLQEKITEIKNRIDSLSTLPAGSERPRIAKTADNDRIIDIAIHGNTDLETLTLVGEKLRFTLLQETSLSEIKLFSAPPLELVIEIPSENLRQTGLKFSDIAEAIRTSSIDIPAGSIGQIGNQLTIRGNSRAFTPQQFEKISLVHRSNGATLFLGEIATIRLLRKEEKFTSRFNGQNSSGLEVFIDSSQDMLSAIKELKLKVQDVQSTLPEGITITLWLDDSEDIAQRLSMLVDNGLMGLGLVFVLLVLFLRVSLAFWVCGGIVISFTGAFWFLPLLDVSLNHISTFAFLLVLGIVVDDAIVIGESIYNQQNKHGISTKTAYLGIKEVWKPVLLGVITTIVAATPGLLFKSIIGSFLYDISVIIVAVLSFSLIESFFILPVHLSHPQKWLKLPSLFTKPISRLRLAFQKSLRRFIYGSYRKFLHQTLIWRYTTLSLFVILAVLSGYLIVSGRVPIQIFPNMAEAQIVAQITLNKNSSNDFLTNTMERLETSFENVQREINLPLQEDGTPIKAIKNYASYISGQDIFMVVELDTQLLSEIPIDTLISQWQEKLGPIPSAKKISFSASEDGTPNILSLKMFGANDEAIRSNITKLEQEVLNLAGVYNFTVTVGTPQSEYKIQLRPEGQRLGITMSDISQQIATAFQGERLDRLPGRIQTTDVVLRLPKQERLELENIEDFPVTLDKERKVPLSTVATLLENTTSSYIERINGRQTSSVDIIFSKATWTRFELLQKIENSIIPTIKESSPDFDYKLSGDAEEEDEFTEEALRLYVLCFFVIYALLAIGSNSYFLPLIILTAAPFGLVGAIYGHYLLGLEISAFSIMGVLAAAGVVINDNLVLVDRINYLKNKGTLIQVAVRHACISRFRPIFLTSLTTVLGLLPILFEGSYQAQFIVPMAISLAFGVLIATFVTLLLVPTLYEISQDIKWLFTSDENPKSSFNTNAHARVNQEQNI